MPSAPRHASPSLFAPVTPGTWSLLFAPVVEQAMDIADISSHACIHCKSHCTDLSQPREPIGRRYLEEGGKVRQGVNMALLRAFCQVGVGSADVGVGTRDYNFTTDVREWPECVLCLNVVCIRAVFALRTLAPPLFVCTHTPPHAPHPTAAITHARPPGRQEEEQAIFFSELMSMGFTDEQIKMAVLVAETPDEIMEILMSQAGGGGGDDGW